MRQNAAQGFFFYRRAATIVESCKFFRWTGTLQAQSCRSIRLFSRVPRGIFLPYKRSPLASHSPVAASSSRDAGALITVRISENNVIR